MNVPLILGLVSENAAPAIAAPPHRRVPFAKGLHALVIDIVPSNGAPDETEAIGWAVVQSAVLSAYAERHDVLPVALGSAFSSDAALSSSLSKQEKSISRQRAELAGRVEYVIAIDLTDLPGGVAEPAAGGTDYLRLRMAARDARRRLTEDRRTFLNRLIEAIAVHAVGLTTPKGGGAETLSTVSALLPRDGVALAKEALEQLAPEAERLGLGLRFVGPCAPFSFVARETCNA